MKTYYATIGFNQSFNGKPGTGYVEIKAADESEARRLIREATDNRWAFMYDSFDKLHPFDRTKLGELGGDAANDLNVKFNQSPEEKMAPTLEQLRRVAKTMLSDEAFKEHANAHAEILKPDIGDDGVWQRLLVTLLGDDGYNVAMVVLQDGNDDKMYDTLEAVGIRFSKEGHHAVAAFLASEAWLSTAIVENIDEWPYENAGDDPNRIEAVVIAGQTLDQRRSLYAYSITRSEDGNINTVTQILNDFDLDYNGTLQSGLLDAFWKGFMLANADKITTTKPH